MSKVIVDPVVREEMALKGRVRCAECGDFHKFPSREKRMGGAKKGMCLHALMAPLGPLQERYRLGRIGYEAYCAQAGVLPIEVPEFEALSLEQREAWAAAGVAIAVDVAPLKLIRTLE